MLTVGIIGTRGIPNRYGGFERFVEVLIENPHWAGDEIRFRVYGEGADKSHNEWTDLRSVGFSKSARPFWYYFRSILMAARECDVILCCGVGVSIFAYWASYNKKPLILNPDGCEWRRTKWPKFVRLLVRALYAPAIHAANMVVIDAEALRSDFGLGSDAVYIPYPAPEPRRVSLRDSTRDAYALSLPYALVVARLEPENNIEMVVDGFAAVDQQNCELIIVGGKNTPYYHSALARISHPNVRFIGSVYDQEVLDEIRSNALVYLHGHSVGGTNPSLLEALATVSGEIFCHENKYNREVAGNEAEYFSSDAQVTELLHHRLSSTGDGRPRHRTPSRDVRFHPDTIYQSYKRAFRKAVASI